MKIDELAKHLSNREHVGLNEDLAKRLGLGTADATRGRLMAEADIDRAHLGVYLLSAYVVDDTDFWGDGEVYWWSIPALAGADGSVLRNPLYGLPNGAPPHKVGSLEWMTNLSLKDPPLVAVIPPEDRVATCILRLAFYDDDGKPANLVAAMTAGLEAFAGLPETLPGPDQLVAPVRQAIFGALQAQEDDILVDQDVVIRRGNAIPFNSGMVGSLMNSMIRIYYFVKNEETTETFGPVMLHRGQTETVRFPSALRGSGRLSIFARGANVQCSAFGELTNDTPFLNRVVDSGQEGALAGGFTVTGTGPAKLIAYYTPA